MPPPAVPGAGRRGAPRWRRRVGCGVFIPPDVFLGGSFGNETKTASSVNAMTCWDHVTSGGQPRQTGGRFTVRQDAASSPLCPCSVSTPLLAAKGTSTNSGAHPSLSPVEGQEGGEDGGAGSTLGTRGTDGRRVAGERLTEGRPARTEDRPAGSLHALSPGSAAVVCPGTVGPLRRFCVFLQVEGLWEPRTGQGHRIPQSG